MLNSILTKVFGTKSDRDIKQLLPVIAAINAWEPQIHPLSNEQLQAKTGEFKARLAAGEALDDLMSEAFAVVREASIRAMGLRHFDTQLMGGMVLHQGKIAEMKTGEGKTLVATLSVYLNALTGKGVHVITVNDYLAERDSLGAGNFKGMGEIYRFLGLTVGCIKHGLNSEERKAAYACDITYGTNNEFGFDYLRDNMAVHPDERVQRKLHYAIVDEVDSILIDEARTPLIISGPAEESTDKYYRIDKIIPKLNATEDYTVEEKTKTVALTEAGVAHAEKLLAVGNLYDPENVEILHHVNQALKAHVLFKLDRDYVVNEDQVIIVDEFTGRLMPGRRFSEGLHQALEAKEGVKIQRENQTLASITFQNYFRLYEKLGGMTGTADTEAEEFAHIYKLDVVVVPTNRPMVRKDHGDQIYRTEREKFQAVADEIKECHAKGRPVLVGTISIERNEMLSGLLKRMGVPHQVLNAKHHAREAEIVAKAGQKNGVTIATNMAGRGTDIVLGEGVIELGGLHVIGTERHESRRIDNQLRGRSGRQGDPGSSRFYVSLQDDLMRIFGSERISGMLERLGLREGEVIEHPWITKALERAQRTVEGHNFDIRKHLLEYDDVMNKQRTVIYEERTRVLEGEDLHEHILSMIEDVAEEGLNDLVPEKVYPENWNWDALRSWASQYRVEFGWKQEEIPALSRETLAETFQTGVANGFGQQESALGSDLMRQLERAILLQVVDQRWKEQLYDMDKLKEGIGLRAYGQKDPLLEYKREGFEMFTEMILQIKREVLQLLLRIQAVNPPSLTPRIGNQASRWKEYKPEFVPAKPQPVAAAREGNVFGVSGPRDMSQAVPTGAPAAEPVRRDHPKVGRNDLCPCGSGKKYKKCHGKNE
ncbi:MAG: preprotein translocase subunit SecA [Candidatus Firestonebacteria bacterium]|nr:preprotein translocase subunit SecA [Candidatus Firestonebacteria bacterium]